MKLEQDDFVIDFNNTLVDLSNLVSTRVRRRSTLKEPPHGSPKRPPRKRLYPLIPAPDSIEKEQLTREMDQFATEITFASRKNNFQFKSSLGDVSCLGLEGSSRNDNKSSRKPLRTESFSTPQSPSREEDRDKPEIHKEERSGHIQIEVYPGVLSPLRDAKETKRALLMRRCRDTACLDCMAKLRCIQDAEYILCPNCKVISPLSTENGYGVGLGIFIL